MRSIVMTIHTFDHSYAGLSASEVQSPSCHHILLPGRRSGGLFINETGNRHLRNFASGKRYREMWQQTAETRGGGEAIVVDLHGHSSARMFAYNRDNPNFNFNLNEVIL
jgi:hypothetical protein